MSNLLGTVWHHGYLLVFLFVLAEACGLPAPAALALVAAGAASGAHILSAPVAIAFAVLAMMLGVRRHRSSAYCKVLRIP